MKKLKKWSAVLVSIVLTVGCFAACSNKSNQESTIQTSTTGYKLVKDGKTEYQILLPEEPSDEETIAASEMSFFFTEATGLTMTITYETDETANNGKYISIGETKLYNSSKVKFDYTPLGSSGYGVKLSEDDVYIVGCELGVIFGTYEFLERQFDYSYFDDGVYTIQKNVTNNELYEYDIEFEPSIEYRQYSYTYQQSTKDAMYKYRMKFNSSLKRQGLANGSWHNFLKAIPVETYYEEHPEWFTSKKDQLCLTRDRKGLATEMAEIIKKQLLDAKEQGVEIDYIHVGHEDFGAWCGCESCKEVINKYGGYHVATSILFMNELSDVITPWMEETGNTVDFTMFAYHETENAPVVYNEKTGKYDLISKDLILRDNVKVMYAPINADYYSPFDGENNENTYANLQGWSQVCDELYIWIYAETFKNFLVPFDNFNSMKANYRLLEEANVLWCYNQAQNNGNATAFSRLKGYLSVKLQWNTDYDVDELIKEYCDACYGDASNIMQDLLNEYKLWRAYTYYEGGQDGNLHTEPAAAHWDSTLIKRWLSKIDEAYASIEKYKETDKDTYNRLYDAILLESLSYRYMLITFFPDECGSDMDLYNMKIAWKTDAARLGLTMYNETKPLSEFYKNWGI